MPALIDVANVASAGNNASPTNVSVTCGAGDNFLLVFAGIDLNPAAAPPTSVTYNGIALTKLTDLPYTNLGREDTSIWYLANPPVGTFTLSAVLPGTTIVCALGALPMSGVNTAAPFGAPVTAAGNGVSGAATAVGAGGADLYVGCVFAQPYIGPTSTTSTGAHQTNQIRLNAIDGSLLCLAVDSIPGVNTGAFSWTLSASGDWVIAAVAVNASGPTSYALSSNEYF